MVDKTPIQPRNAKFQLYELVTLHWNSQQHRTKIVQRWFNPDDGRDGSWFYKVSNDEKLYSEQVFEARQP